MAIAYKNAGYNLANATATTVYSCPSTKTALVKTILVANTHSTNAVNATVTWVDSTNSNEYYLANAIPVPAYTTLTILAPGILVLETSDYIKAMSSNISGFLSVTVSVQEIG